MVPRQVSEARSLERDSVERALTFAGFAVFNCPIRHDSGFVSSELKGSSPDLVMITGDQALTACHVANQVHIISKPALILSRVKDGRGLQWISPDESESIPYSWICMVWMGNEDHCILVQEHFSRRESLCGKKYVCGEACKGEWKRGMQQGANGSAAELEERTKALARCTSEVNTQWVKEMGLKYGCQVEDVITGLAIQCRGWKSIYFNPTRNAFLGVAPTTLEQTLVQHKRWTEGHLQIFFTKHCAFIQGHGKINPGLQMCYSVYYGWAFNAIPTLLYAVLPSVSLLNGFYLFPKMWSPWFVPFVYVIVASYAYDLGEGLWFGETLRSWWFRQRMWLYKRLSAYLFATIDATLQLLGLGKTAFIVTAKATDEEEVCKRYEQEKMEFGSDSPMLTVIATVAMLNLFCFVVAIFKRMVGVHGGGGDDDDAQASTLQLILCGVLVIINWPVYEGLFFRNDMGRLPTSVAFKSITLAMLACVICVR